MDTNQESKMDDVAAKREARRRKILENSKSRLSRITGREHTDEEHNRTDKDAENEAEERVIYPDPEIERDVYVPHISSLQPEMFADMNGGMNPFDDQQQFFQILNNLQQQTAGQGNATSFAAFSQFGSLDGSSGPNPFFANMNTNETPKVPETRLQKFLNTKIHIGLLAIFTYLLISLAQFHWNIFLLFLVWEITEIFLLRQHESNSNGIINILFMFAGLSPSKVNIVLKWIQLLNKVLRDVALFMFFFVLSHVCRAYWIGAILVPPIENSNQSHGILDVPIEADAGVDPDFDDFTR